MKNTEEHLSPGGRTRYTTKPGASDAAKRQALGRARRKQCNVAPREAARRSREEHFEEQAVISPGGNTVYQRPMTPSLPKAGDASGMDDALFALERHQHQMRQSMRLRDARARNLVTAAEMDDQRLVLGLKLLRDVTHGNIAGLSDIQLRGTLVNSFVCLHTPHEQEYGGEDGISDDPECPYFWYPLATQADELKFIADRRENARLLGSAGCCGLLTAALRLCSNDTGVVSAGFALADFLLDVPIDKQKDTALLFVHHGLGAIATNALLLPFANWLTTDFESVGCVFWAVGLVDCTPSWIAELHDEMVEWVKQNPDSTEEERINAHAKIFGFSPGCGSSVGLSTEEGGGEDTWEILPHQPCRRSFCHDTAFSQHLPCVANSNRNAYDFRLTGINLRGHVISVPEYRTACLHVAEFLATLMNRCGSFETLEASLGLPNDFAKQWSQKLKALFAEALDTNLTGYPAAAAMNFTVLTLDYCIDITGHFVKAAKKWLLLFRASGCAAVLSRIANTEFPFPSVSNRKTAWESMRRNAERVVREFGCS